MLRFGQRLAAGVSSAFGRALCDRQLGEGPRYLSVCFGVCTHLGIASYVQTDVIALAIGMATAFVSSICEVRLLNA